MTLCRKFPHDAADCRRTAGRFPPLLPFRVYMRRQTPNDNLCGCAQLTFGIPVVDRGGCPCPFAARLA